VRREYLTFLSRCHPPKVRCGVFQVERLVLNLLMHTFGVATATRRAVEAARKVNLKVRVAAMRKTLPGLRHFEKRAVEAAKAGANSAREEQMPLQLLLLPLIASQPTWVTYVHPNPLTTSFGDSHEPTQSP